MTTRLPGPLGGTRVVTFAAFYQGPYATTLLADLGADVITVERPGTGDPARAQGGMFEALNRGKRSMVLDLKRPADQETARRLVGTADVLVEAFRPGTMERFGLGYPRLSAVDPGLVYVSVSGFGQDGPYRDRAGHDLMYQAAAGLLDGLPDRPYSEWQEEFDRIGVPAGPVHRLTEALTDPHVRARAVIRTLRGHPSRRYVRQPLRLSEYAEHAPGPAPRLGEHTAPLLRELDDTSPYPEEVTEP